MASYKDEKYRSDNARKVNAKRFPDSKLYILKIKDMPIYKIGVSQSVKRRMRDIQSALPFDSKLIALFDINDAYQCEKEIHDLLKEYELRHEWFEIPADIYTIVKESIMAVCKYQEVRYSVN